LAQCSESVADVPQWEHWSIAVSRHHTLPPIITTPEPPKPQGLRRRRAIGGVWRKRATDGSDDADEIDDRPHIASAQRSGQSPSGVPLEATERRIPSPSGKLSDDTLKAMLELQEATTKDDLAR
jgi:hypothetical protein